MQRLEKSEVMGRLKGKVVKKFHPMEFKKKKIEISHWFEQDFQNLIPNSKWNQSRKTEKMFLFFCKQMFFRNQIWNQTNNSVEPVICLLPDFRLVSTNTKAAKCVYEKNKKNTWQKQVAVLTFIVSIFEFICSSLKLLQSFFVCCLFFLGNVEISSHFKR